VEPFRDINNMAALQHIVLALDGAQATQQVLADNPTRLYGF
jgi:predicted TIM-barrel fold metal-dependent hydrolase